MDKIKLTVLDVVFPRISIAADSDHDPSEEVGSGSFDANCTLHFTSDEDEKLLHASFFFKTADDQDANLPYKIDLHVYAIFSISQDPSSIDDEVRDTILVDMANVIIGSTRDMIATITSRSPWSTFQLQIFSAFDLADNLWEFYLEKNKKKPKRRAKKQNQ